jgi:hypothetical protein
MEDHRVRLPNTRHDPVTLAIDRGDGGRPDSGPDLLWTPQLVPSYAGNRSRATIAADNSGRGLDSLILARLWVS